MKGLADGSEIWGAHRCMLGNLVPKISGPGAQNSGCCTYKEVTQHDMELVF